MPLRFQNKTAEMVFLEKEALFWKKNENMKQSARGERESCFRTAKWLCLSVKRSDSVDFQGSVCCDAFRDRDELALTDS